MLPPEDPGAQQPDVPPRRFTAEVIEGGEDGKDGKGVEGVKEFERVRIRRCRRWQRCRGSKNAKMLGGPGCYATDATRRFTAAEIEGVEDVEGGKGVAGRTSGQNYSQRKRGQLPDSTLAYASGYQQAVNTPG